MGGVKPPYLLTYKNKEMKKIILLFALLIGFISLNAQVRQYTAEGEAVSYGNMIIKDAVIKNKSALLTDSTAVPTYDLIYLKTTKAVRTILPAGTVSGQRMTITMVTDGGNYTLVPRNLFINDTILFDDAGDYWEGVWRDTTWITITKTATIK